MKLCLTLAALLCAGCVATTRPAPSVAGIKQSHAEARGAIQASREQIHETRTDLERIDGKTEIIIQWLRAH